MVVVCFIGAFRCRYCGHEVAHAVSDDDGGANESL